MVKVNGLPLEVDTPNGKGFIEDILVTDLGYIQIRVRYPSEIENCATFIKYTITTFEKFLNGTDLSLATKILKSDIIEHDA